MLDELAIFNLGIKHPNTFHFTREVEKITREDTIIEVMDLIKSYAFQNRIKISDVDVWCDELVEQLEKGQ